MYRTVIFPPFLRCRMLTSWVALSLLGINVLGESPSTRAFIEANCLDCHDTETKKGGLDLATLPVDLASPKVFATWVTVHDRVTSGEMPPPKKKHRPEPRVVERFTNQLARALMAAETEQTQQHGRATLRRLNRYEYEETLRDLLSLPSLEVRNFLPEDTVAYGFNKVGEALDVSHVQLARYLQAADFALRSAMAPQAVAPTTTTNRFYAWDQGEFFGAIRLEGPLVRRTFPLVGLELQRSLMDMPRPKRLEPPSAERREKEAMGVVVSTYEPTEVRFGQFRAPITGRYRLKVCGYSFWMGRQYTNVLRARRDEPVTLYSDTWPRILRKLGSVDFGPDPTIRELEVQLLAGESVLPDAARLHRSRPPDHQNPLAEADGMPGVAFQWLEVVGPLTDDWPPAGHQLLFGKLPMENWSSTNGTPRPKEVPPVIVRSEQPDQDVARLMASFLKRVYRVTPQQDDVSRFVAVIHRAEEAGYPFTQAMLAGYTAVLCSPEFLYFHEAHPGRLDDWALAERLSYFLANSAPDSALRLAADQGRLHRDSILNDETERLLNAPGSRRFINAFLDYWLDLRGIPVTAPDTELYPDYQLDDLLVESMTDETQLFMAELIRSNANITNLVLSDFSMLNERLAQHYGIPGVNGVELRRVNLPKDGMRGGLLTQASILKVTSNGTSTSPVKRGAWVMSRIVGRPPPPPPPSVPAVDPDIRGATTIREQLAKHRSQEACAACHRNIDPAGFALESFDVMGGWRDRYRAVGTVEPVKGIGHNGVYYHFGLGQPVDASGELPDGRGFADVRQLKQCLAADKDQLARNLARQLIIYSTGAPIRFSDRAELEKIVQKNRREGYGIRSLIHAVVQSDLFRNK